MVDVLFLCDFGTGFDGADYHGSGVGGTEALVVLLAEDMARRGLQVAVAVRRGAGVTANGVRYEPIEAAGPLRPRLVVLVKQWSDSVALAGAARVFLATDVHVPDPGMLSRCFSWAHHVLALSDYQRRRLLEVLDDWPIEVLGAPVAVDEYAQATRRRDNVLLYCSVPDRGLYHLARLFPRIRRRVPDARLVITSDFSLWGLPLAKGAFMKFFDAQPGVEYRGHVSRSELVDAQCQAKVMAYPCTFEEGFCMAAAECMAAGAVPVTTADYALVTTVGHAGVLVPGRPRGFLYRQRFVRAVERLLVDDDEWSERSSACRRKAAEYHPTRIADRLLGYLGRTTP